MLNHWDNLDGTIERGYAGNSIWKWDELPGTISPRYAEYARANASIGINATVLNNVNASPKMLEPENLAKVKAIAERYNNVTVIDGMKMVPHFPEYFLDNLHPNALGCEIYGRNLAEAILKATAKTAEESNGAASGASKESGKA